MKKIVIALGLSLSLCTGVCAADSVLDQLNEQVVNILAPFQSETTHAQFTFGKVETDADRALNVALNGIYRKVGWLNIFDFKVDNLSYNYGDGSAPMTIIKGSLGVDFTKLLTQDQINEMVPFAADLVEEFAQLYSNGEYGDAVSVRGVVTSTTTNTDGNYNSLSAIVSAKIDLTKIPEDKSSEDIMLTDSVVYITLNVKTGMTIDAYIISNPAYIGFQEKQEGLKEILDQLLAGDEDTIAEIGEFADGLEYIASLVVGEDAPLKDNKNKIMHDKKIPAVVLEKFPPKWAINIKH